VFSALAVLFHGSTGTDGYHQYGQTAKKEKNTLHKLYVFILNPILRKGKLGKNGPSGVKRDTIVFIVTRKQG